MNVLNPMCVVMARAAPTHLGHFSVLVKPGIDIRMKFQFTPTLSGFEILDYATFMIQN